MALAPLDYLAGVLSPYGFVIVREEYGDYEAVILRKVCWKACQPIELRVAPGDLYRQEALDLLVDECLERNCDHGPWEPDT